MSLFSLYPWLHSQVKEPGELTQTCSQLCFPSAHRSMAATTQTTFSESVSEAVYSQWLQNHLTSERMSCQKKTRWEESKGALAVWALRAVLRHGALPGPRRGWKRCTWVQWLKNTHSNAVWTFLLTTMGAVTTRPNSHTAECALTLRHTGRDRTHSTGDEETIQVNP